MKGGGGGRCTRSHLVFLGAWSKPLRGGSDPFIVELLALWEGVIFVQLRGYSHVILEVDFLELVNQWKSRDIYRLIIVPILRELEEIVLGFVYFWVNHVERNLNVPTHQRAKCACTLNGMESWLDQSPEFLIRCLMADCNLILVQQ